MANPNHTFSKPVELHEDEQFDHAVRFAVDKRDNALVPVLGGPAHVVAVDNDEPDQMDDALRAAGADLLGGAFPYARFGYVRVALRPASRGAGRGRWR